MALFNRNSENENRVTFSSIGGNRYHKPVEVDMSKINGWDTQKAVLREMARAGVKGLPNANDSRARSLFFKELSKMVAYKSKYGRNEVDLERLLKEEK
mgnify:FL=1